MGYLWTLLRPLALFTILYIVFVKFLRVGDQIPYFAVYLLVGIVFWNFFVEVTLGSVGAIVAKGDLMRKLSFPRYVIIVAGSFSASINLLINMVVVFLFMLLSHVPLRVNGLLIVFPLMELFVFSLSVGLLLSALFVRFRDINYIWEVALQAGFYATPILYPITLVMAMSITAAKVLMLNPMAQIIQDARAFLVTEQTETIATIYGSSWARLIPVTIVLLLAVVSVWYFKKRSPYFAEEV
ncbi:MAG: type transport system permease protein [Patescibacteria group bacterium]|nr:type transport system permease protein [Patescibacteria group bacterium]